MPLTRSVKVVEQWGEKTTTPLTTITIGGVEFSIPERFVVRITKPYKIGEYLDIGSWSANGTTITSLNLCNCDGEWDPDEPTPVDYPQDPGGGGSPDPPEDDEGGEGDNDVPYTVEYPLDHEELDVSLPECSAGNDSASGHVSVFKHWEVLEWKTETRQVCIGLEPGDCSPNYQNQEHIYAAEIKGTATVTGSISCTAKETEDDAHDGHSECDEICSLDGYPEKTTVTITQEIQLTPTEGSWNCSSPVGEVTVTDVIGFTAEFTTSTQTDTVSSGGSCLCIEPDSDDPDDPELEGVELPPGGAVIGEGGPG